ncbi:hypothetical protein BX666DRAFT_1621562 [Dichotomocladium elegans]|nr:hypothetical protein BX666DRAFT_1621562 [Dichotomocladium elegans]
MRKMKQQMCKMLNTKSIVQFSDQDNLKASSPTKHNDYANDTHSTSDVESQDTKTTCFKENEDITGSSDHMKPTPRESPNKSILSSRLNTDDRSFKEEQAKLQALNSEHCPLLNTSQSVARADQVPSATPRVRLVEPPKEAETQKELIPQDTERRIEGGMRIGSRLAELHGIEPHQDKEDMRIERLEKYFNVILACTVSDRNPITIKNCQETCFTDQAA